MRDLAHDLRYAARTLAKNPGFTAVAVLTLALGIGANGAVFSVLRALLLRPLPYAQPERLVMVWSRWSAFPKSWLSVEEYRTYAGTGCFEGLALFDPEQANLTGGAEPERIGSALVSANLFEVLGVRPLLGRSFNAAEVGRHPANVVILSEELWRRRFGGARGILGASIDVNGAPKTVVGVMPAGFKLPLDYVSAAPSALWLPLNENLAGAFTFRPMGGDHNYDAIGRLHPGVSVAQARARLRGLADGMTASGLYPRSWHFQPLVIPVVADLLGPLRLALLALGGAVGFVLLIACANVANLLLVRGMQRRKELAVRLALGAAPGRLLRQLLAESCLLSTLGGTAGLGLTWLGVRAIVAFAPLEIPRVGEVGMDGGVAIFVVAVSLATALLFGLAPAVQFSRPDLQASLKEGGRAAAGPGAGGGRFQSLMVVAEVALAMVLLMGASLMVRTFRTLAQVNPGFRAAGLLTMGVSPWSRVKYPRAEALIGLYDEILDSVRRLPGVEAAGAVRALPLATELGDWGLQVEGFAPPAGESVNGDWQIVTPGYFETMGIPLLAGRSFTAADRRDAQPVIVISAAMAQRFWPGKEAIGRRIRVMGPGAPRFSTVVGVVGDVLHNGLTAQAKGTWYLPRSQFDLSAGSLIPGMTLVIKTAGKPTDWSGAVRAAIHAIDPQLPVSEVRALQDVVGGAVATHPGRGGRLRRRPLPRRRTAARDRAANGAGRATGPGAGPGRLGGDGPGGGRARARHRRRAVPHPLPEQPALRRRSGGPADHAGHRAHPRAGGPGGDLAARPARRPGGPDDRAAGGVGGPPPRATARLPCPRASASFAAHREDRSWKRWRGSPAARPRRSHRATSGRSSSSAGERPSWMPSSCSARWGCSSSYRTTRNPSRAFSFCSGGSWPSPIFRSWSTAMGPLPASSSVACGWSMREAAGRR
jgi:putative ABC transport system permease protein